MPIVDQEYFDELSREVEDELWKLIRLGKVKAELIDGHLHYSSVEEDCDCFLTDEYK